MRNGIAKLAAYKFTHNLTFHRGNTSVESTSFGMEYRLHGNLIARRKWLGDMEFSLSGWNTPTTKRRLKELLPYPIVQKNFRLYYNGIEIDEYQFFNA